MIIDGKNCRAVTSAQMREIDRAAIEDYGIPGEILMENAGRSITEIVERLYRRKGLRSPVLILCGKGNNGGDGMVVARHLHNHEIPVRVMYLDALAEIPAGTEPALNGAILAKMKIDIEEIGSDFANMREALGESEMVLDALLGTGLKGTVRAPFDAAIEIVNAARKFVVAVDAPSGLDCDAGTPLGCAIVAAHTVTLGLPKTGFENPAAKKFVGQLHLGEICLPRELLKQAGPAPK